MSEADAPADSTQARAESIHVDGGAAEEGGDAACWANRVCPECGRLNDAERPEVCQVCGARFLGL